MSLSRRALIVAGGAIAVLAAVGLASATGVLDDVDLETFAGTPNSRLARRTGDVPQIRAITTAFVGTGTPTPVPTATKTPTPAPSTPPPSTPPPPTPPPSTPPPTATPVPSPTVGAVWSFGGNSDGQLGIGTTTDKNLPVPAGGSGFTALTTPVAGWHTLALKSDGTLWAWGDNMYGQSGGTVDSTSPAQVSGVSAVTAIAGGRQHSVAVSGGEVWMIGNEAPTAKVAGITGVTAVAAGDFHTLALKSDGTVWAWGGNANGQLGDGTTSSSALVQVSGLSGVTAIAAGAEHSLALKSDGTVWAWGVNEFGQCGDATLMSKLTPVQVAGLSGITAIAGGARQSMALKSDGTPWAWGQNTSGQLGDNTTTSRPTPAQVGGLTGVTGIASGRLHGVALKGDGTVWAWGENGNGQLGDGTFDQRLLPVQVTLTASATAKVTRVAAARTHSAMLYGAP